MKARVQKWGRSLAIRIPKSLAKKAKLREGSEVRLSVENGKLIVEPIENQSLTLEELLRGMTAENLHGEWDTGPAVGREIW
jgi:antitoxin MazE